MAEPDRDHRPARDRLRYHHRSVLVGERLHLFFEFLDEKTVRVIELFILSNPSGRTLVSGGWDRARSGFRSLKGAANLEFQEGALGSRYVETADGFADTVPVRPGSETYQILFAFEMPYDRKLELVQPVTHADQWGGHPDPRREYEDPERHAARRGVQDVQGTSIGPTMESPWMLDRTPDAHRPAWQREPGFGVWLQLEPGHRPGRPGLALALAGAWLYTRPDRELPVMSRRRPGTSRTLLNPAKRSWTPSWPRRPVSGWRLRGGLSPAPCRAEGTSSGATEEIRGVGD